MTTTFLTWEEFVEKYEPEYNVAEVDKPHPQHMYETYGKDYERILKVRKTDPLRVWTIVDGSDGNLYVINGWHYVNRFGYIITKIPFTENEHIEVEY